MKKRSKVLITVILAVVFLFAAAAVLGGAYLEEYALSAPELEWCEDSDFFAHGDEVVKLTTQVEIAEAKAKEQTVEWFSQSARTVSIQSFDNITLNARLIENEGHNYAVFMHGYKSNTYSMGTFARHFYDAGFTVYIPGQRSHGWSEGNFIDMGYFAKNDVKSWCEYIVQRDKDARIILHGVSMGGATVLMASALDLPSNVLAVVSDCAYTSAWDQFALRLKIEFGIPNFPMLNIASFISNIKYGFSFEEASPLDAVAKSKVPILFVHGLADDYIPLSMMNQLYDNATCVKSKAEIPGGTHARSVYAHPEMYWDAVDSFVKTYISDFKE